jgi:hypothetical protein
MGRAAASNQGAEARLNKMNGPNGGFPPFF